MERTFSVGERTYELLLLKEEIVFLGKEAFFNGNSIRERGVELKADMGKEDGEFVYEHSEKITADLRGLYLLFPNWSPPEDPSHGMIIDCEEGVWLQRWSWLGSNYWVAFVRLVRRIR